MMESPVLAVVAGVLALLGGIFALLNPLAATLTAETLAAWSFIIVGVLQIVAVFRSGSVWTRALNGLVGVLFLMIGGSLLSNPLAGVLSLTLLIAILFLMGGAVKLVVAFAGGIRAFWVLAVSGAISLILAFLILSNFPASATTILGVLLAIELISSGISLIAFGLADRRQPAT